MVKVRDSESKNFTFVQLLRIFNTSIVITSESFQQKLVQICRDYQHRKFLLAVSGGVDSMVLAELFHHQNIDFHIAHINYKLRGNDSEQDQKKVENFCEKNSIPVHIYQVSDADQKPEGSIQLWARELRYQFFSEILEKEKLDFLVTAHHLNDNLETFIINLSRGSGIKGLSGIPKNANNILRPLLSFSKDELYAYAAQNQVEFGEDYSNKKNDYLRNQIRNEIVPLLMKTNVGFLENFAQSIQHLSDAKDFVKDQISKIQTEISTVQNEETIINKIQLAAESTFVQFEILRKYGYTDPKEISKIFTANIGSQFFSEDFVLLVDRNHLIISSKSETQDHKDEEKIIICESKTEIIEKRIINLRDFITLDEDNTDASLSWELDLQKIKFPIILRHRKEADLFYPIGMKGKQKISKFLKDKKISIFAKQKIWLLTDDEENILGIIPFRQDRRFAAQHNDAEKISIIYQNLKK